MSQAGTRTTGMTLGAVMDLTGDTGGAITPIAGNINILGGNNIQVDGTPGTLTINVAGATEFAVQVGDASGSLASLPIGLDGEVLIGATGADPLFGPITSLDGSITFTVGPNSLDLSASSSMSHEFDTDSGTAIPVLGVLDIIGGQNIQTSGAGNVVTVEFDGILPVTSGGTGQATLLDHGLLVGSGLGNVDSLPVGTNGQVLVGNTGLDPVFATLTSSNSTISFTPGAGALSLQVGSAVGTSFPTDAGTATPSSGVLNILGAGSVSTSGAGNTVTITAAGGGFTWSVITGASQTIAVKNGYFANRAGVVAFTLPAAAAVGDTFSVYNMNTALGWSISQAAGQTIKFGNTDTTVGVGGSLASTANGDGVEIVCSVANTNFVVVQSIGNITVV